MAATRDDDVAPFFAPELARVPALDADLEHLAGPCSRRHSTVLPATARYCARLRELGATWPGGVLAHHYVRYLGDLSGGQVVGRVLRRVYGLGAEGTAFYRFEDVPSPRAFKACYRARLDALAWRGAERDRFVDEVVGAFRATTDVLDALMSGR